jgi:hypothetical protein
MDTISLTQTALARVVGAGEMWLDFCNELEQVPRLEEVRLQQGMGTLLQAASAVPQLGS